MSGTPLTVRWAVAVGLLLRLLLIAVALQDPAPRPLWRADDTPGYLDPAADLLATGQFLRNGRPAVLRTPGYSVLLLPGVALGHPAGYILLLQAFLGAGAIWLLYRLASLMLDNPRAGVWAAWLMAVEPLHLEFTTMVLTDLPAALMVLGVFYLLALDERRGGYWLPVAAGLAAAAAAFVRPVLLLLLPVVVAAVALVSIRVQRGRRGWVAVLLAAVCAVVPVRLWSLRNLAQTGYPGFCSIGSIAYYKSDAVVVLAKRDGRRPEDVMAEFGLTDPERYLALHPEQRDWPFGKVQAWQEAEGKRLVLANLGTYLPMHLAGMGQVLLGGHRGWFRDLWHAARPPADEAGRKATPWLVTAVAVAAVIYNFVVLVLACLAFFQRSGPPDWRRRPVVLVMVATAGLLWVASGSVFSASRYRLPFMWVLCLLAGVTLARRLPWPGDDGNAGDCERPA